MMPPCCLPLPLPRSHAANIQQHPMAALLYGFSLHLCLPSGMSAPGGAALGTMGMSAVRVLLVVSFPFVQQFPPQPVPAALPCLVQESPPTPPAAPVCLTTLPGVLPLLGRT